MTFALALTILLVIYNDVIIRWPPFHGSAYVPVNVTFAAAVTLVTAASLNLSPSDLGWTVDARELMRALAVVVVFAVTVFAFVHSRHVHRIVDRRVAGLVGTGLAFYVLIRIPLGTAATEELLFRGVLYAAWDDAGTSSRVATLVSAAAFGLWHVQPTIDGIRINDPLAPRRTLFFAVTGAILFTTLAGLGLTWLRLEGGLLPAILLHAGINSTAAAAAVWADRRGSDPIGFGGGA